MRFKAHHHEKAPPSLRKILKAYDNRDHKTALWNAFVDSKLSGINDDDCHILPRVLPGFYLPTIRRTAQDITLFVLRLLSLPEREIKAIVPSGPIRDFLIRELGVLRYRPERLTGSFRFDMAVVGVPDPRNPPRLLEINEIGFDGLARSSFIQETLLGLIPELKRKVIVLDTAAAEARNMRRLGRRFVRFQDDFYNWEEEALIRKAGEHGVQVNLISPREFGFKPDKDLPLLSKQAVRMRGGRIQVGSSLMPDALQIGFSFRLADYLEAKDLYRTLVRSKTPQYGPFLTGLVASKMILVLLDDPHLRGKLLGSARRLEKPILPAIPLQGNEERAWREHDRLVLKHVDGLGGEMVFIGADFRKRLRKIESDESGHWILQERVPLNTIDVHGILSRPRQVISDLGVFVQYDWARGRFLNFEVGGFITRATNRSFKVNVSGGGIQVPVMFSRV